MNPKLYPFISATCLVSTAIGNQLIMRNQAELVAFRTLALNLIPQETAVIAPMLSEDIQKNTPDGLRNTFWTNTLCAITMGLINIPCMYYFGDLLTWIGFNGLSLTDEAHLQAAFRFDYINMGLSAFMNAYLSLLFQTRHTGQAAAVITLSEVTSLLGTLIAQNSLNAGLPGFAAANLLGTCSGVILSVYFDQSVPPLGKSLFNFKTQTREDFQNKLDTLFKLGWPTWLAVFTENTIGTYSSFLVNCFALQGALGTLTNACNEITDVVTDTFAPYIAENQGEARRKHIYQQIAWGTAPSILLGIVGTIAAAPLSNALANGSEANTPDLYGNVAFFMFCNILNNLEDILYETFIDCSLTKTPAFILIASDLINLGLCFALSALLGNDSNLAGNLAILLTTFISLAGFAGFIYKERSTLFYDLDASKPFAGSADEPQEYQAL